MNKIKKKRILISSVIIVILLIIYTFIFGKLFPFSPFRIGFQKHELDKTIVYIQNGATFDNFNIAEDLTESIEQFHDMNFINKPEIYIFKDDTSYKRLSPSRARFCAFFNGRLFISPWALKEAEESKISMKTYLTHELSHVLIFQHCNLISKLYYPKWALEGFATYSSNQMGVDFYPSKEETLKKIAEGNFLEPEYFDTYKEKKVKLDVPYKMPFIYAEFACMINYLDVLYGREKLISFIKTLTKNSNNRQVFQKIYGINFEEMLLNFKEYANNGKL